MLCGSGLVALDFGIFDVDFFPKKRVTVPGWKNVCGQAATPSRKGLWMSHGLILVCVGCCGAAPRLHSLLSRNPKNQWFK